MNNAAMYLRSEVAKLRKRAEQQDNAAAEYAALASSAKAGADKCRAVAAECEAAADILEPPIAEPEAA